MRFIASNGAHLVVHKRAPIEHGTVSGYRKELNRGLRTCVLCRKAWNRNEWLKDFIGKARAGEVPLPVEQIDQLQTWCEFASPSMHDDPTDAAPPPSPDNVRAVVREVLEFVHG